MHLIRVIIYKFPKWVVSRARSKDYYDKILLLRIKEKLRMKKSVKNGENISSSYMSISYEGHGYFEVLGKKIINSDQIFELPDDITIIRYTVKGKLIGPYKLKKMSKKLIHLYSMYGDDLKVTRNW